MTKKFFNPTCPTCPTDYNKGEKLEWHVGYDYTGTPSARNNKPAQDGGDVLDWQVKAPKASLTGRDNCNGYIFGFADDGFYYEMSKERFASFVEAFGYIDRDSKTGKAKVRIKNDSKKMREWLERA